MSDMWDEPSYRTDTCYTCGGRVRFGTCAKCDLGEYDEVDPDRVKKAWEKPWVVASRQKVERIAAEAIAHYEESKLRNGGRSTSRRFR